MEKNYREAFASLNPEQLEAVKTTEGPLLVIAGPGTGKTQLLSTRVGYILQNTDTPANAILLLTFTEAGAATMRERLESIIGRSAYDIQIFTYHAFGGEIFRRYPDFMEGAELSLIEDLNYDSLLREIISNLSYSNPLKFADNYIGDLKSFISEAKKALLSPKDIEQVAIDNLNFIKTINKTARPILDRLAIVSKKSVPLFEELAGIIETDNNRLLPDGVLGLEKYIKAELDIALDNYNETTRTTGLTAWKRRWLAKDDEGKFIVDGRRLNERLKAAAGIYGRYQQELKSRHLYDYDDMIIKAIDLLETNKDLKYSLAEQYSYIMLDEFQDTNAAQFKLVQLLTDHPVNEGRPNIMAVGDDDQAIYAFQGAEHANMLNFAKHYRDVKVISLKENYRSTPELIMVGQNIANQIQSRLHFEFENINKELKAANNSSSESSFIQMREFLTDAAQYAWLAQKIQTLIRGGLKASDIAVLAPKHRNLIPLLPFLTSRGISIRYERRENLLDEPIIRQIEQTSRLILALAEGNDTVANSIWPEVLSYEFWNVPIEKIWRLSWESHESHEPWTALIINDKTLSYIVSFMLRLAALLPVTTLEQQLDAIIGVSQITEELKLPVRSPMYEYYFSDMEAQKNAQYFTKLITDLNILRSRLREWYRGRARTPGLRELVEFIDGHRAANLNIINTSPYHETENSVNLLTAYGAKGREFQAVFIIAALDEVWGSASRNQGYRLSLPANLNYIRYQGASEDERLRLLFVAVTRPRTQLYITSYKNDLAGRKLTGLKYLGIEEESAHKFIAKVLPPDFHKIKSDNSTEINVSTILNYWTDRHISLQSTELKKVLQPKLDKYQLSATHLNKYTDIVNAGPSDFFFDCLLNFPAAPTITGAFGTAMHNSLRFAGNILNSEGKLPDLSRLQEIFDAQLNRISLPATEIENLKQRGHTALQIWLKQSGAELRPTDWYEYNFRNENSVINQARLSGTVDRIIVDGKENKLTIIDYKTGQSYKRWQTGVIKLHKFQQQLMFYKLLIENSNRFNKYRVDRAFIEFIEPDENGKINRLEYIFNDRDLTTTASLINSVWEQIQTLNFPSIDSYQPTLKGIRQFESDLVSSKDTG